MPKKTQQKPKRRKQFRLAQSTVNALKKLLLEKRRELISSLDTLNSSVSSPPQTEEDTFSYELSFHLLETQENQLNEIDFALRKLSENSYGICASCERAISFQRLKALPNATLCIDCKTKAEKESF